MARIVINPTTFRNSKDALCVASDEGCGRPFFGEDFSYDGKKWDPKLGFVKKGGK